MEEWKSTYNKFSASGENGNKPGPQLAACTRSYLQRPTHCALRTPCAEEEGKEGVNEGGCGEGERDEGVSRGGGVNGWWVWRKGDEGAWWWS